MNAHGETQDKPWQASRRSEVGFPMPEFRIGRSEFAWGALSAVVLHFCVFKAPRRSSTARVSTGRRAG